MSLVAKEEGVVLPELALVSVVKLGEKNIWYFSMAYAIHCFSNQQKKIVMTSAWQS